MMQSSSQGQRDRYMVGEIEVCQADRERERERATKTETESKRYDREKI
jgi:hypothetical protein